MSVPVSPAKSKAWSTTANAKLPEPSVFINSPAEPSPSGNVNVVVEVTLFGALSPICPAPLFVPSLNFIVPPTEVSLPKINSSIALFESAINAPLAVNIPGT